MKSKRIIEFSPPDITNEEINAVIDVLKSGWITSGLKVKNFETEISNYIKTKRTNCLSSATAAMGLALKIYGVKEGDEVIVPAYTYASTANVIVHTGAKVIFLDAFKSDKNDFNINVEALKKAITTKTKAIIAVDIGGYPCDYDDIIEVLESKKNIFSISDNKYQNELKRPLFLLDAAHSIGAIYKNNPVGTQADFTSFSFHAVKNITTAEGGALSYNDIGKISSNDIYREISVWSLHGQDKSAFDKAKGGWKYSIEVPGYKCNMSDIHASIGLSQLKRYDKMLEKRKRITDIYNNILVQSDKCIIPTLKNDNKESSYHLYPLRIKGFCENDRDKLIENMKEIGIILNVHYLPLPAQKAYIDLGYDIKDYTNAFNLYENEVTLPLYSTLIEDEASYVAENIIKYIK